jgi:hypothetical protein
VGAKTTIPAMQLKTLVLEYLSERLRMSPV